MNIPIFRITALALVAAALGGLSNSVSARSYALTVDPVEIELPAGKQRGIGYNGSSPGPVLRFVEGEEAVIKVTNNLDEATSVHWHGLVLPFRMDGVPTISFDGIAPGETFTYRFPISQAGTYWYHSHSGFQEPDGAYGAIVIEPRSREPFRYDRDYVVQLADKHPHPGSRVMRNLKSMPDYYNRKQQTVGDFFRDVSTNGLGAAMDERRQWGAMRMMRTDVEDVQGFTGLINGKAPDENWTALFAPGERIRLRFINSSAMTYFDLRIPGLTMTVVQADGNNVQPVVVDELRIAVAETYDVIVHPKENRAYTIFGESMGRSGFVRGTLAPRSGMEGEVPALREPPLLTMADMGMEHAGMDHAAMSGAGGPSHDSDTADTSPVVDPPAASEARRAAPVPSMDHRAMGHDPMPGASTATRMDDASMGQAVPSATTVDHASMGHAMPSATTVDHASMGHAMPSATTVDHASMGHAMPSATTVDHASMGHAMPSATTVDHASMGHAMPSATTVDHASMGHAMPSATMDHASMGHANNLQRPADPFYAPGSGLVPEAANGGKFLSYADLRAQRPIYEHRPATREIEIRLTGNMERYIWSIDGIKYEDAEPIRLKYGERVRFKFVNTTMMAHPMHLHGMWSILDVGAGEWNPIKHVINVAPGSTVFMETEVDAPGQWAFHCHLSYHASSGMFRKVMVESGPEQAATNQMKGIGG